MPFRTVSEIRQFNENARQALDELKRHQAASDTSIEASRLLTAEDREKRDGGGGLLSTDRTELNQHLELAEERVAKGKKLVARQREIVDELERDGHALAANARVLLAQFEELQEAYVLDRDWLKELSELR
jgi:hypothetical protein